MKKYSIIGVGVWILGWSSLSLAASESISVSKVTQCTTEMSSTLKRDMGVRVLNVALDTLGVSKDAVTFKMVLQKGARYVFVACGEETFNNLDIKVYNGEGLLIQMDNQTGRRPMLQFQPPETGFYLLRITSKEGTGYFSFLTMMKIVNIP